MAKDTLLEDLMKILDTHKKVSHLKSNEDGTYEAVIPNDTKTVALKIIKLFNKYQDER